MLRTISHSIVPSRLWITTVKYTQFLTFLTSAITQPTFYEDAQFQDSIPVNSTIYDSLIEATADIRSLSQGKQLHTLLLVTGLDQNVFFGTKLVRTYAIFGDLEAARLVFDRIPERNVFIWNAMIRGYARKGLCNETFSLYTQMQQTGIRLDKFTFACVLGVCTDWQQGKDIHEHIVRCGIEVDAHLGSALISMYGKRGCVKDARDVFDKISERDVVSWNTMIAGYAQNGLSLEALEVFREMESAGMKPDAFSIASVIPACGQLAALQQGQEIHGYAIRNGFESNAHVISALVAMYPKCGRIDFACHMFDKMPERDLASWSAMIAGFTQAGESVGAVDYFRKMQRVGIEADPVALSSVLPACTHLTALQQGREIHCYAIKREQESDVVVCSALIDMYAKCGNVGVARKVFNRVSHRNVVSWNAMIAGYGIHGHDEDALTLFYEMRGEGIKPDHITFIAVLCACSHAGLVDDGLKYFDSMMRDYQITPRMDHCVHLVNLLGRAGRLDDALNFIENMPLQPDAGVWGALLGSCKIHGNVELGEHAARKLFELDPENAAYYVMLSNIYAVAGRWNDVVKTRTKMKEKGLKKNPGCSWIEIDNWVYTFLAGDRSHPQSEEIYAFLENMADQMKRAGCLPDMSSVFHDVKEDEREQILCGHSEKLAIAFGLLNTCPGTPILVNKNLRVCDHCHSAIKFISNVVKREIILRDMNRFHHFKDGLCSCRDYW